MFENGIGKCGEDKDAYEVYMQTDSIVDFSSVFKSSNLYRFLHHILENMYV